MLWLFLFSLAVLLSYREQGQVGASFAASLACIVNCGKWMRPCVVSITTLLCLTRVNPSMCGVKFFNTTICSVKLFSPKSNSGVTVAVGSCNCPFVTWIWILGGSSVLKTLAGLDVRFCPIHSEPLYWNRLLSQRGHLLFGRSRNLEVHTAFLFFVSGQLWRIVACRVHSEFRPSQVVFQFVKSIFWERKCCHLHCHWLLCTSLISLYFKLLFLGVTETQYWCAPSLVFQEWFRTKSGYLGWGSPYWRRLWFYIFFCLNWVVWVLLRVSVVEFFWIKIK